MKPLKLSFLLILTGSVLLLSAVSAETREGNPEQPVESKIEQTKTTKKTSQNNQTVTKKGDTAAIIAGKAPIQKSAPPSYREKETKQGNNGNQEKNEYLTIFNGLIAVFTIVLAIVGLLQWRLLYWQFVAEHRPKIKIRNVHIVNDITKRDSLFENGVEVSLVGVNWGGSAAKIVRGCITTCIDKPDNPEFMKTILTEKDTQDPLYVKWLKPSAEYVVTWRHPAKDARMFFTFRRDAFEKKVPPHSFYVFGYLVYRDRLRRHYKTHFCRRFDTVSERFVVVDHPDYEYAD